MLNLIFNEFEITNMIINLLNNNGNNKAVLFHKTRSGVNLFDCRIKERNN
jgi:hypothetical protein